MKHYQKKYTQTVSRLLGWALAICLGLPLFASANAVTTPLDLATIPLANSPTVSIQPNLLFVLDDSGSMGWNWLPDWANSSDPTYFRNAGYNTVAYNPATRYDPPAFFDAGGVNIAQYPSQTGVSTATGADASAKPNWNAVKNNAYIGAAKSNVSNQPSFFTYVAGEYCTAKDLKTCITASGPSVTHPFPAGLRWCNAALTSCQAIRVGTFNTPRHPRTRVATITITNASSTSVSSITVSGGTIELLSAATTASSTKQTVADRIVTSINNNCTTTPDNCFFALRTAADRVSIYAPFSNYGIAGTPAVTWVGGTVTPNAFGNGSGGVTVGNHILTVISPNSNAYTYPGSATKAPTRTDCAGATCTYNEEMTNYANWWTYYQTRMQMMKTAAGLAFKDVGVDFRVGFMTIHPAAGTSLKFDTFNTSHKAAWYSKFFSISPGPATPLRSALSIAGRIYAKKNTVGGAFTDPIEYECQQNFTLLTTDGYWNSDTAADILKVDGSVMTNQDMGPLTTTPRPMYEGPTASSNSLADVAKYYHDTDLRTAALGNCTGALGSSVCQSPAPSTANIKQNMVTLTLGLGIDGTLAYTSDYKKATSGDFFDIKNGTNNWSVPAEGSATTIDDLWHAAVNGEGTYFSAKSPTELVNSLKEALASIEVKLGAGAAAATSTLNPVAGDNSIYTASYTSGHWTGNLEKRNIDVTTGVVDVTAANCVEDVASTTTCTAPSSIVPNGGGGFNCETPTTDPLTCPVSGVWDGAICRVPVAAACTGTLKSRVSAFADTRNIKMNSGGGALVNFSYGSLSAAQKTTFESAFLAANLTQWLSLTPAQRANATPDNLVNYLRGQTGYEENSGDPDKKVFRKRYATLGDAIDAKPAFLGKPNFSYTDPGYAAFKTAQAGRAKTVYLGANDGMLHAFDADTLQERWAYVPTMVIPNMWKLADAAYTNKHSYYVNGNPIISDICVSACNGAGAVWKTILVAGLNGGGRGYYALDITDPTSPLLLWELDANDETNVGYTFGNPVITKKPDGTWVVLVTSGYNNIPDNSAFYALPSTKFKPYSPPASAQYTGGDGQGYLYVLDALSGNKLAQIATGAGSTSTPSGLAKIRNHVGSDATKNNSTTYVYGGDLLGNLWRFNIVDNSRMLLAKLEAGGTPQPITTRPELGLIKNKRVVFVGTGKYLEIGDLTDTSQQTLYAIKDDNAITTLMNPRSTLVQQTVVPDGADNRKSGTGNAVDFNSGSGWYVDFPDSGERQNVASQLSLGTLSVPTIVPTSSACQPAGYGWANYFDYKTGLSVVPATGVVSTRTSSPIVGQVVVYIDGKPILVISTADGKTFSLPLPINGSGMGFQKRRSIWRELVN